MIGGSLDNDFDDVSIIDDIDAAMAAWAIGDLADTLDALGDVLEDDDKDYLFGQADDDEFVAGIGDKVKQ